MMELGRPADLFPHDFDDRLAACFAEHVWPLLSPGSPLGAFAEDESLRLLAHNVDFWLPYGDCVAQERVRDFGRADFESDEQRRALEEARGLEVPPEYGTDYSVERPLRGGHVWFGEGEAWEATQRLIHLADRFGKLRGIVDAVRSHRVADDFSPRWSRAKEDFERKLYSKRSRTRVSFVELDETIPVHGPDSEVEDGIFWQDFLTLLDTKERHVIVCLRNGHTQSEIASAVGYRTHSAVSKVLAGIRRKAQRILSS